MRLHYPALLRVNIRRGRMCRPELHILTSETTQISK
jgi:hypothetical protein